MDPTIVAVALIAYAAVRQVAHLHRRKMIHRERLAAIEKGVSLPSVEREIRRGAKNVQRFLLLAGLVWLSLGMATFVTLSALLSHPTAVTEGIPQGLEWIGVAPACIGLSHLIVYAIGRRTEGRDDDYST